MELSPKDEKIKISLGTISGYFSTVIQSMCAKFGTFIINGHNFELSCWTINRSQKGDKEIVMRIDVALNISEISQTQCENPLSDNGFSRCFCYISEMVTDRSLLTTVFFTSFLRSIKRYQCHGGANIFIFKRMVLCLTM